MVSKHVYSYFCNGVLPSNIKVDVDQLSDGIIKFCVEKIMNSVDDAELIAALAVDEVIDLVSQSGYRKPLPSHTLADKETIVSVVLDYHLMMKVKSCMDQFMDGLKSLGFLDRIQSCPSLWEPLFVGLSQTLTADLFKGLFNVEFASKGSNVRVKQEQAYIYFLDFLDECHDGDVDCSLEDVMVFFTGSNCVPPIGFEERPILSFTLGRLATSSTCALRLQIPSICNIYNEFKDALILSFKGNDGFEGV